MFIFVVRKDYGYFCLTNVLLPFAELSNHSTISLAGKVAFLRCRRGYHPFLAKEKRNLS